MRSPAHWPDAGGPPRSRRFGDLYFSAADGLAESRAVFLEGCGLPGAWRGRPQFTVAELGFGTGRNIAALLELWQRAAPADAWLSVFSVEDDPMPAEEAARALSTWPELAPVIQQFPTAWPGRARGFHRLDLTPFRATLDIAVLEAAEALAEWTGAADVWFLDGFAPRLNPDIWRQEVLDLVAARSAPGARLSTYTAAGEVRRGLEAAGFAVERRPGFGGKRHRLEARWPGSPIEKPPPPRVAVIGGGIAGASLHRAFLAQGVSLNLISSHAPAASRGPAALVTPRLDAGLAAPAALHARAFARARETYGAAVVSRGALQLAVGPKDRKRFAAIAASDLFEPDEMRLLSSDETSTRLGEAAPAGLAIEGALVVDPAPLLEVPRVSAQVARMERRDGVWRLLDADDHQISEAEAVVIAAGMASAKLLECLPLRPVRGQASVAKGARLDAGAVLFGGYAAPIGDGVVFGATHDRDNEDLAPREADHDRNLASVAAVLPGLAASLAPWPLEARTGVRVTTRDYMPIAGLLNGLFVLTGLGSRGFCLAPLLADHVAALVLDRPSPLAASHTRLVEPGRDSLHCAPGRALRLR